MLAPPEALRKSMERARRASSWLRIYAEDGPSSMGARMAEYRAAARHETRETVRALRAARRAEGVLLARWGVR